MREPLAVHQHVHTLHLTRRIDDGFAQHLESEGVEFLQFAFRWVNCLLVREVPFQLAPRLWDTYLAEGPRLKEYLIYVLAAFLLTWKDTLRCVERKKAQCAYTCTHCRCMDFQEAIMFLQKVPSGAWTTKDLELVLSQAYAWRASFKEARAHLT